MEADLAAYRRQSAARPDRLDAIESSRDPVIAVEADYANSRSVPAHWHSRAQLMHPLSGLMLVETDAGRWMVPEGHALWMPARMVHAVEMVGGVRLHSAYVDPDALPLAGGVRAVAMTPLLHELIARAVFFPPGTGAPGARLILELILHEIPALEERPLALPMPRDPRLAGLCRLFLEAPAAHLPLDDWAERAGMSRRSLTRHFREETGLSLSRWRQQASLFAALPRLAAGEAVTNVALDLGYDSVSAFTTMFRRVIGSPPRAWAAGRGQAQAAAGARSSERLAPARP